MYILRDGRLPKGKMYYRLGQYTKGGFIERGLQFTTRSWTNHVAKLFLALCAGSPSCKWHLFLLFPFHLLPPPLNNTIKLFPLKAPVLI